MKKLYNTICNYYYFSGIAELSARVTCLEKAAKMAKRDRKADEAKIAKLEKEVGLMRIEKKSQR